MSLEAVLTLLSTLPPGENPYTHLRSYLRDQVIPVAPESFRIQLYFFLAILSLILISTSFSLAMACRKSFWFFRLVWEENSRIPYLLPHATIAWLTFAVLFIGAMIGCVTKVLINSFGILCLDLVEWETLSWMPIFLSGWLALSSITISYIIQQIRGDPIKNSVIRFLYSPVFVNSVAITVPTAYIISGISLSVLASRSYREGLSTYIEMDVELALGEQLINNGGKFSLLDLTALTVLEGRLWDDFQVFTNHFGRFYIVQSAFALLLIFILITFAFLTLRSLRKAIDQSNRVRAEIKSLNKDSEIDGFIGEDPYSLIEKTYYKMFITIVALLVIGIAQSASAMNVAVTYQFLLSSASAIRTDILIALYLFVFPVLPLNVILAIRSLDSTPGVPSISSQFNFPRRWLSSSTSSDSMKTLNEKSCDISKLDSATSDLNRSVSHSSSTDSNHVVELKVFLEGTRIPLEV